MPKLTNHNKNQGSILVGALAIAILLAISGLGFMQVSSSSLNNETEKYLQEKAFNAAESGIWLGVRWLRSDAFSTPETYYPTGGATTPIQINGMYVFIAVQEQSIAGIMTGSITSEVYSTSSKSSSTFLKRMTVGSATINSYGQFGTFFNEAVGWAGFFNRQFEGRFHMNRHIIIHTDSRPGSGPGTEVIFSNGLVTAGTNPNFLGNYGAGAHDNNNYDNGVLLNWPGATSADADVIFRSKFIGNWDNIALPVTLNTANLSTNPGAILLTASSVDNGENFNSYRPTLILRVTGGQQWYDYHFINAGGAKQLISNQINTGAVFISNNNLNVSGTVKTGFKLTLATALNRSICPVGNITYASYNSATNTVPAGDVTMLGLVAGKYLRFNNSWLRNLTADAAPVQTNILPGGTMLINASVTATNSQVQGLPTDWWGTEWWDHNNIVNYGLTLFGNHILEAWQPPNAWDMSYGAQGVLRFTHDLRLASGLQPPGFPTARTMNNLWTLRLANWSEDNTY